MTGNKPIAKFQAGQVSAALWETDAQVNGRAITILKASIERRFKDRDGVWQFHSQRAFDAIIERQQNNGKAEIDQAIEEQRVP